MARGGISTAVWDWLLSMWLRFAAKRLKVQALRRDGPAFGNLMEFSGAAVPAESDAPHCLMEWAVLRV